MSLTANNETIKGPLAGAAPVDTFAVLGATRLFSGGLWALDSDLKLQPAADAAGLQVAGLGVVPVDNRASLGLTAAPVGGIWRLANSVAHPLTRAHRRRPCFVEDDCTVASTSTHLVLAGLVVDVDSDGVWVDVGPAAQALAQALLPQVVPAATIAAPAAATAGAPAVTYSAAGTATYGAPSGGETQDAEARTALAQVAVDRAADRTTITQLAADLVALRAELAKALTDAADLRSKLGSALVALKAAQFVAAA